jgi:hypothetical protein
MEFGPERQANDWPNRRWIWGCASDEVVNTQARRTTI